ncbi:MAG: TIGR02221 family CRISPR-associated protein [Sulfurovum sp.]|nr:TIGR02221 family CRISPR-associated protein [Sulfurovum sp.]
MAKILISSLGTGEKKDGAYKKAKYSIDNKTYETSFIADALHKHFDIEKIFIIGTKKSIWDEAYTIFGGNDHQYLEELFDKKECSNIDIDCLQQFEEILPIGSKCLIIDYGLDENELWKNFEQFLMIAEHIQDGDEVYLDITHSFRSLSLMSYVMTQFASSISDKNFKVAGVFYGMYEYSYEHPQKITPIVDLKILLELQEWIKAIDAIKKYSDFDPLVKVLNDIGIEANVYNTFSNLNNMISMANMGAMKQFIETASKKINSIKTSSNKIVALLVPEILKLIEELHHEKMSDFQYALAKWFYRNKNYAQSYIALFEAVVTKTCEIKFPGQNINDKKIRDEAKGRIDYPYNKYFLENKDKKNENLDSVSSVRHSIAHQINDRKNKVMQDIQRLETFLTTFESYFKQ